MLYMGWHYPKRKKGACMKVLNNNETIRTKNLIKLPHVLQEVLKERNEVAENDFESLFLESRFKEILDDGTCSDAQE